MVACAAVVTSMMTPPLSISARPVFRRRLVLVPLFCDILGTVWIPFRKREGWAPERLVLLSYNAERGFTRPLALEDQKDGDGGRNKTPETDEIKTPTLAAQNAARMGHPTYFRILFRINRGGFLGFD